MKYLSGLLILVAGLSIGFFVGRSFDKERVADIPVEKEYVTKYIRDTVVQTEKEHVPVALQESDTSVAHADTLTESEQDSLLVILGRSDTTENGEYIPIRRERLVSEKTIPIIYLTEPDLKDTTIKDLLGIDTKVPHSISMEFWESPLNYSGYKFSGSKLIIYGMSPQLEYKLYKRSKKYFLGAQEVFYRITETADFLKYQEVSRDVVFND